MEVCGSADAKWPKWEECHSELLLRVWWSSMGWTHRGVGIPGIIGDARWFNPAMTERWESWYPFWHGNNIWQRFLVSFWKVLDRQDMGPFRPHSGLTELWQWTEMVWLVWQCGASFMKIHDLNPPCMLRFNALHGRLEEKLPAIMSQRTLDKLDSIHLLSVFKYGSWRKQENAPAMYWVFMLFFPARTDVFYWQDPTPCCNIGTHQHLLSSDLAHRRFCEMSSFQ